MHRAEVCVMYEYLSDVLRAKGISPADAILIRHAPRNKGFMAAGFIREYTSMQADGFAESEKYFVVFIGEGRQSARFFSLCRIAGHRPTRKDNIPQSYPNKDELEKTGGCFDLEEIKLPDGLTGFVIDWGKAVRRWHQSATNEKPIIQIIETGGVQA